MTPKEATRKRDQLSTDLASAEEALGHNQRQLEELHGAQRDHDTFDRDAAQSEADNLAAQETRITGQLDRAQANLESAQSVLRSRELELTKTRWLTKERRRLKAEIADLRSKQAQLQKQCGLIDRNLGEVRESLRSIVEAVRTYDSYDADATFRRIAALESHAEPLSAQVADLIAHQRRVDDLLGPLLRERQDLSETMQKREADTKRLLQQQKKLDKQVDSAKRLQHELNDASTSYERKLIHQQ